MQVSKFSAVLCAFAIGCTATIQAADTPAQAAARAAIASKLFELSNTPATNKAESPRVVVAPTAPVTTSAETKAKAAEAKVLQESAKKSEAQQAAAMATANKLAKAEAEKAAAEKKLAEKKAAEKKAAEIAAAQKQAKANTTAAKTGVATKTIATKDTPAQSQAREALANSMFESSAKSTASTPPTAPKSTASAPILGSAPPLPISASKQQQLQALLAKYKADQVTPDEYQKQRAAIIAQP